MADEINKILQEKNITDTRAVAPKIALPIFEEATLEEDPSLQNLWNHLLVNAMDPMFGDEIRYSFIEIIKGITGIDAKLLSEFYDFLKKQNQLNPIENVTDFFLTKEEIIRLLNINSSVYLVSAHNLMRMQLISPAFLKTGSSFRTASKRGVSKMENVSIYKGTDVITLTPFGVKFIEACM